MSPFEKRDPTFGKDIVRKERWKGLVWVAVAFVAFIGLNSLLGRGGESSGPTTSETAKSAMKRRDDIAMERSRECREAVRARAQFPSSVDFHMLGSEYNDAGLNDKFVVSFDAKNGFGAELPYRAVCIWKPGGGLSVEIAPR